MRSSDLAASGRIPASPAAAGGTSIPAPPAMRIGDLIELTKPRINMMVLAVTGAGFYLGTAGKVDPVALLSCLLGTALLGSGGSALNQYWERRPDGVMSRTGSRPLPTGRLVPPAALGFGSGLAAAGLALLFLAGWYPVLLGILTFTLYLFVYTPLKRVTPHSVFVGAIPGALPPLIGWAASGRAPGAEAWALFAILFIWQVPHFMAIAWLYREDYRAAGFPMISVHDPEGRVTALEMNWTTVVLILASLAPAVLGFAGRWYLAGALLLGLGFLAAALSFARERTDARARLALRASIIYLPLLFLLLILDRV